MHKFYQKKKEEKRKNKKIRPYERFTLTSIQSIRSYILPLFYSIFHFQISKYFFLFYLNIHRDIFYQQKKIKRDAQKKEKKKEGKERHIVRKIQMHTCCQATIIYYSLLGHWRSIQGGSSSCMNPSFKRAKKRPN